MGGAGVLDDGDGLHEVSDGDLVAGDGEGDGSCGGAVGCQFGKIWGFERVYDDLELVYQ